MPQLERTTCNAGWLVLLENIKLANLHDRGNQQLRDDSNPTTTQSKCQTCTTQVALHSAYWDTDHVDHLWVYGLCDDVPVVGDVLHHLAQRGTFHLLPFQVAQRVGDEVEEDAALPQLLDEQFLLLGRGDVCEGRGQRRQELGPEVRRRFRKTRPLELKRSRTNILLNWLISKQAAISHQ